MNKAYIRQVGLLLNVLPEVAKESCFAMHGGTAINLFVRNMPRLSVDIDLTYIKLLGRQEAIEEINAALFRIKQRVENMRSSISVQHRDQVCKLQLDEHGVQIKIEVNVIGRGLLGDSLNAPLCEIAQEKFDVFCVVPIVPMGQLYGGKLCAALDRQHPRDLFDVKLLLDNEGFTDEIKQGFLLALVSSSRPTHELINPNILDQRVAYESQFDGMSTIEFSYNDFEGTRQKLFQVMSGVLTVDDKAFLLRLNRLEPDWSLYDYKMFPAVQWKLLNLEKFKRESPQVYAKQLDDLEATLMQ